MKYLFCNWKMYLDLPESEALAKALIGASYDAKKLSVAIFPSYPAIPAVANACKSSRVAVGAQDCYWVPNGAYTGAVSAHMLATLGCRYVLVGHSERRHVFGETDTDVRKKIEAALDAGLTPVVCIGETKEERAAGQREYRLKKQLMKALADLSFPEQGILVTYEPVWAISQAGIGEACSAIEAADVHRFIRTELQQYTQRTIPIIYGGSVAPNNVQSYLASDAVDGVLVGHASTKVENLLAIIENMPRVALL